MRSELLVAGFLMFVVIGGWQCVVVGVDSEEGGEVGVGRGGRTEDMS